MKTLMMVKVKAERGYKLVGVLVNPDGNEWKAACAVAKMMDYTPVTAWIAEYTATAMPSMKKRVEAGEYEIINKPKVWTGMQQFAMANGSLTLMETVIAWNKMHDEALAMNAARAEPVAVLNFIGVAPVSRPEMNRLRAALVEALSELEDSYANSKWFLTNALRRKALDIMASLRMGYKGAMKCPR